MNFLSKIFKRKEVIIRKTVAVALPLVVKWTALDQKTIAAFLKTEQGLKFMESCRHKLFKDHLDACAIQGRAEYHNASMRGANDILFHMLYLASEDSISGPELPANYSNNTDSDILESDALNHRE